MAIINIFILAMDYMNTDYYHRLYIFFLSFLEQFSIFQLIVFFQSQLYSFVSTTLFGSNNHGMQLNY